MTFLGLVSDPFKWLTRGWKVYIESPGKRSFVNNKMLCGKTIEFFHQKKNLWNSSCLWPESTVGWLVSYQTNTFHHSLVATLAKHGSELHLWFLQVFRHHSCLSWKKLNKPKKSQQGRFSVKKVTEKSNPTIVYTIVWFDQTQSTKNRMLRK